MRISIMIFSALLLLFSAKSDAHAWLKLRIATTEYAPYTSTSMEHNGYINHIISKAFLETGVIVEFTSLPWDEALEATLNGEYDALSYGNYIRSREKEFWHSEPISVENLVFYINESSGITDWASLDDLKQYKMGITNGYLYNDELASYIKSAPNVVSGESDKANFDALIDGDIDIFPIDELTGWYILQREFSDAETDNLTALKPYISTVTTHLLVPKGKINDKLVLSLFNEGLQRLQLQGEMERFKRLLREGYYQHPEKPVNYDRR